MDGSELDFQKIYDVFQPKIPRYAVYSSGPGLGCSAA